MKRITFLIIPLLMLGLIMPVFADSQISGFADGGVCCSPNPQSSALLGVCFTISNTFALTRATLSLSKDDPNAGSPPFVGTLTALIYATTGSPNTLTCSSGVGSILATSNSIAFTDIPGEILPPGSYIIAMSMGYTSGAGSLSFTGNANTDASQTNVDDGGSFGTFTPGDEYDCAIFGANTCMSYQLFGNPPSAAPSKPSDIGSIAFGFFFIIILAATAKAAYENPKQANEILEVGLSAAIVVGVIFIAFLAVGI